jgi:hypothetical protein
VATAVSASAIRQIPCCTHVSASNVDDPQGQTTGHDPGEVSESDMCRFSSASHLIDAAELKPGTLSNDAQRMGARAQGRHLPRRWIVCSLASRIDERQTVN